MSIVKGARNMANAKKFYDWALTPEALSQRILPLVARLQAAGAVDGALVCVALPRSTAARVMC